MAQMQGGGAPGGAPMDPSMMGGAPAGAPPMDPAMAAQGGAPMDPSMMGGAPMDPSQDPMVMAIADAVGKNVQDTLQQQLSGVDKKIAALVDKLDSVKQIVDSLISTTNEQDDQSKQR